MKRLQHPNIVMLLDSFETKDEYCLVMEVRDSESMCVCVCKVGGERERESVCVLTPTHIHTLMLAIVFCVLLLLLLLQHCGAGDLQRYIEKHAPLKEAIVRNIAIQLRDAFEYLASKDIVHRDLKPHVSTRHRKRERERGRERETEREMR